MAPYDFPTENDKLRLELNSLNEWKEQTDLLLAASGVPLFVPFRSVIRATGHHAQRLAAEHVHRKDQGQ